MKRLGKTTYVRLVMTVGDVENSNDEFAVCCVANSTSIIGKCQRNPGAATAMRIFPRATLPASNSMIVAACTRSGPCLRTTKTLTLRSPQRYFQLTKKHLDKAVIC